MPRTGYILRDYQSDIVRRVLSAWRRHPSVLVQMPTGTGKTVVLASLVGAYLDGSCGTPGPVWIVAHRRELVGQARETVGRFMSATGGHMHGSRVRVMSIQWLSANLGRMPASPGLVVVDEAHHAPAGSYKELWSRYPHAMKLGMTATPCRLDGRPFTGLFGVLVAAGGIAGFIRRGWLSAFDYYSIRPGSADQRLVDGLSGRGPDGDYAAGEMDAALNSAPGIGRLYDGLVGHAPGKKGIVYAVSVSHARNIARYYTARGISAAAIDGKTPAARRKQLVDDFRRGALDVLVNVDVFSEGFDCPDVGFIQLARPTLSLAKYLQQVGRGLRKPAGKETCVILDHAGLYRQFGLPTAERDWQSMFEGRVAGKGLADAHGEGRAQCPATTAGHAGYGAPHGDGPGLEAVVSHGSLLDDLGRVTAAGGGHAAAALSAFKDPTTGLYGLERGEQVTVPACYPEVFDASGGLAAVRLADGLTGVVDDGGNVLHHFGRCRSATFLDGGILALTDGKGSASYVDLPTGHAYGRRPEVLQFGRVQMLDVGGTYYSRTADVYTVRPGSNRQFFFNGVPYLRICDYLSAPRCRRVDGNSGGALYDSVCLLAGDHSTYYRYCGRLPGVGTVVVDKAGRYYLVDDATGGKEYICHDAPAPSGECFDVVIPRLRAEGMARLAGRAALEREERARERDGRLSLMRGAEPFRSGLKWGLRLDGRVLVPPIYRSIKTPAGNYCAVERAPRQWGVIMLDGKVVVEARYTDVRIDGDGTAHLTSVTGKTETVDLTRN